MGTRTEIRNSTEHISIRVLEKEYATDLFLFSPDK